MGLIIRKRIGGKAGLNLSKSGVSASLRTRGGSIGTKGYSVRTGIPGVYFRGYWKTGSRRRTKTSSSGTESLITLIMLPFRLALLAIMIVAWIIQQIVALFATAKARTPATPKRRPEPPPPSAPPKQSGPKAFAYVARDWSGNRVSGTIDVQDKMLALKQLERMRLVPVSLEPSEK
jgi:hypothetical protein